eukprot:jgi/Bigna1/89065/estExt_fgenesh1_pg.C_430042
MSFNRLGKSVRRFGSVRQMSTASPYRVLQFHGDGVGPEIVGAAERVLEATGVKFDWVRMDMGYETYEKTGHVITEEHLQAMEEIKVIFKGPLTIPPGKNPYGFTNDIYTELRGRKFTSGNQVLRKCFDLYANVRPAKLFPGLQSRFSDVDLLVVRENTEDVYTGEEKWVDDDTVEGVKRITRKASTRIAEKAFEFFLEICREVAKKYPEINFDEQLADSLLTKMVMDPSEWDVLLCPNLYGDMVSDLAAGIVGSLGLCPSGMYGTEYAVFEPCHGSAPDIAGKDISNPVSQVLSGAMLLRHLGEGKAAESIEAALEKVTVQGGNALTPDLGGTGTNTSMTDAIIKEL